jgi:hypothetical protein
MTIEFVHSTRRMETVLKTSLTGPAKRAPNRSSVPLLKEPSAASTLAG